MPQKVSKQLRGMLRTIAKEAGLELPPNLRPKMAARVRSKIGTLTVREEVGIVASPAQRIVKHFEGKLKEAGNGDAREELRSTIGALEEHHLTETDKKLLELLTTSTKSKSLARICVDAKMNPLRMMNLYAKGCVALKRVEAAIDASRAMPRIVKSLQAHALAEVGDICPICAGTAMIPKKRGTISVKQEEVPCFECEGVGRVRKIDTKLKQFSMEKLMEVAGVVEKTPGVQVTTNVGVKVGNSPGVFQRILDTSEAILYKKPLDVVDALEVSDVSS